MSTLLRALLWSLLCGVVSSCGGRGQGVTTSAKAAAQARPDGAALDLEKPAPGLILTLFRDSAMIWDRRTVELPVGDTEVVFEPALDNIDARSATLVSLTAPDSISVRANPPSQTAGTQPLRWTVTTKKAGAHLLEAAYVSTHVTWRARYRLHVRADQPTPPDGDEAGAPESWTGQLGGSLEITNHSKMPLKDALIRVTDTRRIEPRASESSGAEATGGDIAEPRFIDVPQRVSLAARTTTLVPLLAADSEPWPLVRGLLFDPVKTDLRGRARKPKLRRDYGLRDEENPRLDVRTIVELQPDLATGASGARSPAALATLPAGHMTVVADTERGSPRALGGGQAFERLTGAKSRHVEVGSLKSVRVYRRQADFFLDEYAERLVEEIRITLENRDVRAHRVLVREHMYRGRNWSVGYHNGVGNPSKIGVQSVRFDVDLAPGETQMIVYRVVYTW